jgi:hypothetical protein
LAQNHGTMRAGDVSRRGAWARRASPLLLLLSVALVCKVAEASLTRPATLGPTPTSAPLALDNAPALDDSRGSEPRFDLFAGDELLRGENERPPTFHPLAAVSLLPEDARLDLAPEPDARYLKTRVWAIDVLGSTLVTVSTGLSLEAHWACGDFSCGLSSGGRKDPLGLQTPGEELDPSVDVVQKAIVAAGEATGAAVQDAGNKMVRGLQLSYEYGPGPLVEQGRALAGRIGLYGRMAARPQDFSKEEKNVAARQLLLDAAVLATMFRAGPSTRPVARGVVAEAAEADLAAASTRTFPDYADLLAIDRQIRLNAEHAMKRALRRSLTGAEAGRYADEQFNILNEAFQKRLARLGSPYEVKVQPARDVFGDPVPARTGGAYTRGSKRLDATIEDTQSGQVERGYDITISLKKWNSATDNAEYMRRFQLQDVIELNPQGPR